MNFPISTGILCCLLLVLFFASRTEAAKPMSEAAQLLAGMPGYYRYATRDQVERAIGGANLRHVVSDDGRGRRFTPLMHAARETNDPDVIDLLIDAGCDLNALDRTGEHPEDANHVRRSALHYALENPDPAILEALLRHKPKTGDSGLLYLAFAARRSPHILLLLKGGVKPGEHWSFLRPNTTGPLRGTLRFPEQDSLAIAEALVEAGAKPPQEALFYALQSGLSDVAIYLIELGLDPSAKDEYQNTPLVQAVKREKFGHALPDPTPELISLLVRYNDVNAPPLHPDAIPGGRNDGRPLTVACEAGIGIEIIRLLVDAGAEYDVSCNDLLIALLESGRDRSETVSYLLRIGFSPVREGKNRRAAPLYAASVGGQVRKPQSARVLVEAGADPSILRESGRDAEHSFGVEAGIYNTNGDLLVVRGSLSEQELAVIQAERDAVVLAAQGNPDDALYDEAFYRVATPEQVRDVANRTGKRRLGIRSRSVAPAGNRGGSHSVLGGIISVLTPDQPRIELDTPLIHAARATAHPEVVEILVDRGSRVEDVEYAALKAAVSNPNSVVLEAVLRHMPQTKTIVENVASKVSETIGQEPRSTGIDSPLADGETVLHDAARAKEASSEHVKALIAAGANLNARDRDGYTPLMRAIACGHEDRAHVLIEAGADLETETNAGIRPLDCAIGSGAFETAMELIRLGVSCEYETKRGDGPLDLAARESGVSPALLEALAGEIGERSDAAQRALFVAMANGNMTAFQTLLKCGVPLHFTDNTALHRLLALRKDDADMAEEMLKRGVDPNAPDQKGASPLFAAAGSGQAGIVRALLRHGADVDARGPGGYTPLLLVAGGEPLSDEDAVTRRNGMIEDLIRAGANVDAETDDGWSPILLGLEKRSVLNLLIESGADTNRRRSCGWTPLTLAANRKYGYPAIPLLLESGADPGGTDSAGRTPETIARQQGHGEALALLGL